MPSKENLKCLYTDCLIKEANERLETLNLKGDMYIVNILQILNLRRTTILANLYF